MIIINAMAMDKRAVIKICFFKSYLKNFDKSPVPIPNNKTAAKIITLNKLTNKFILSQILKEFYKNFITNFPSEILLIL